jgi:hypothetical protein
VLLPFKGGTLVPMPTLLGAVSLSCLLPPAPLAAQTGARAEVP